MRSDPSPSGSPLQLGRLAFLLASLAAGVLLWEHPVLWPVKLLVVAMHESGHALAALFVGGSVQRISLSPDESGFCLSLLPPGVFGRIAVSSAGYVGSAIAGAVLLVLTFRFRLRRLVLGLSSAWLLAVALLYARDLFTLAFCIGTAAVLGLAARFLPPTLAEGLNLFLAAFTALYAVFDLRDDLWHSEVRARSDAAILAASTYVPAVVWAAVWTAFSLILLGTAVWWSMRSTRPALARSRLSSAGGSAARGSPRGL